jgi:hypothetical protein
MCSRVTVAQAAMRFAVLTGGVTLGALLLSPLGVRAQANNCGVRDTTEIEEWTAVFADPSDAELRQLLGISAISTSDARNVVTDGTLCRKVVQAAEAKLSKEPIWSTIQQHGWTYTVLRFGRYLALAYQQGPPPLGRMPQPGESITFGPSSLMIFSDNGKKVTFIGRVLKGA